MPRELTPEEVQALGLEAPAPKKGRELTPAELRAMGLENDPAPAPEPAAAGGGLRATIAAMGRGLTSDFDDELGAAGQIGLDLLSRTQPRALTDALGIETRYQEPFTLKKAMAQYRQARGENRQEQEAFKAQLPEWANDASEMVGGMLQPGGAGKQEAGAKVLKKALGKAAGRGAIEGGISGLGKSKADLFEGEFGKAAVDVGLNTALGAAAGPFGEFIGQKVIGPLAEWAGGKLKSAAARKANSILTNGAGTFPSTTGAKVPVPEEVGLKAMETGAIRAGGTLQGAAERGAANLEQHGEKVYGPMMDTFSDAGIGARMKAIAEALEAEAKRIERETGDKKLGDILRKQAAGYREIYTNKAGRLIDINKKNVFADEDTLEVPIRQSEGWKRTAQTRAREGYERQEPTLEMDSLMAGAGALQRVNEEAVAKGTTKKGVSEELRRTGESFIPVKKEHALLQTINKLAKGAAARESRKPPKGGVVEGMINTGLDVASSAAANVPNKGGTALKKALAAAWKERIPSTGAVATYDLSRLAGKVAENPGAYGAKAAGAAQRAWTDEEMAQLLRDYFASDEELRIRATRDLLRGKP